MIYGFSSGLERTRNDYKKEGIRKKFRKNGEIEIKSEYGVKFKRFLPII
jgi:hypothetical protein